MKDSKNMVIGMLCAVVCIMAVAYAAFATTLNVTTTATVSSNWCVKIDTTRTTCPTDSIVTNGAANSVTASVTPSTDALSATVNMTFTQPGDEATCNIVYTNCGTLDAAVTHTAKSIIGNVTADLTISDAGVAEFTTANDGIEFYADGLVADTLTKDGGSMVITVRGRFLNVVDGQETPAVKSAKIRITSKAEQAV